MHTHTLAMIETECELVLHGMIHVQVSTCQFPDSSHQSYLIGRSPNMAPLYCKATGTESGWENSTKANLFGQGRAGLSSAIDEGVHLADTHLVGWVSSPAMRTYLISPHGWKKVSTCSAVSCRRGEASMMRTNNTMEHLN